MSWLRYLLIAALLSALAGCAGTKDPSSTQANRHSLMASDTSRTIDLTQPPRDMWDRIRRGFAIPNLHDDLVDHWTQHYAARPQSVLTMSQRASKYLYHIVEEIERRGLPTELALLPFVESAYDPTALSRSQASGLWQFIPSTGRHYKLQQDWWLDQRRDPIASTAAALDYLAYLYDFQGDWYLALASYNWGEGAVRRAMAKNEQAGLATDYLSLNMPDETQHYVPKLQAIKNLIVDPKRYGLNLPEISNTPYFLTVRKHRNIDVEVAARLAEIPVEEFLALNAAHNQPVILAEHKPTLLLPADRVQVFNSNLSKYTGKLSSWKVHTAQRGETYASIAKQYGVSLTELRQVNGLGKGNAASAARALLVPDIEADPLRRALASGELQLASLSTAGLTLASPTQTPPQRQVQAKARTHTVKNGDTLFGLARRYNTSVTELRRVNNIKGSHLAKGARLRIPAAGGRT